MDLVTGPQLAAEAGGVGLAGEPIPPLYHREEERESVGGQLAISTTHIYLLYICCGRAHQTLHNSFPLERGTACRVVWERALRIT